MTEGCVSVHVSMALRPCK